MPADTVTTAAIADGAVTPAKQGDTGWVTLTIVAPFAVSPGFTPQIRKIGNVVYLRGAIGRASGFSASFTQFATIPAGFRPAVDLRLHAGTASGAAVFLIDLTSSSGVISIFQTAASTAGVTIDNTWTID